MTGVLKKKYVPKKQKRVKEFVFTDPENLLTIANDAWFGSEYKWFVLFIRYINITFCNVFDHDFSAHDLLQCIKALWLHLII
jgi:hypothetical protein